jgi:hypothetical protein
MLKSSETSLDFDWPMTEENMGIPFALPFKPHVGRLFVGWVKSSEYLRWYGFATF